MKNSEIEPALEEIKKESRHIMARHGLAEYESSTIIFEKQGINPHQSTIDTVCKYYGVEMEQLLSPGREQPYVLIRQVLAYLLYVESGLNHDSIANLINRDRCTALYSVNSIRSQMRFDKALYREVAFLTGLVNDYTTNGNNNEG